MLARDCYDALGTTTVQYIGLEMRSGHCETSSQREPIYKSIIESKNFCSKKYQVITVCYKVNID